jgi:hypothetical protein
MRLTVLVVATGFFATAAQAEPVHLACYGKIRVTDFRDGHAIEAATQEGQSMSLTVDRSAGTIAVQEYDPVKLMGRSGEDTWLFNTRSKENTQIHFDGYVNSVTGETVVDIHHVALGPSEGSELRRFEGTCRPASQLSKTTPPTHTRTHVLRSQSFPGCGDGLAVAK